MPGVRHVPFDLVLAEIEAEFQTKKPQANAEAARLVYEKTVTAEPGAGAAGDAGDPRVAAAERA